MDLAKLIRQSIKRMSQSTIAFFQSQLYFHLGQDQNEPEGVDGFLRKLNNIKNNIDSVNCLYEKLQMYDLLNDKFKRDKKSDTKAIRCKEKGNKFFSTGNYTKALKTYTKTLMKAEDSELIAIAFANRSAALFKLGLLEECLTDIDRALAHNYPENLKPKLLSRKAKAAELLRKSKKQQIKFFEDPPQIPANQKNPSVRCASNCVEVKNASSRKRIIATRDIQIGEVLAVETPFTATIAEVYLYHCHECFNLCYNPIPCEGCTQVLYCSTECKQNAHPLYHKYECPILLSLRKLLGKNTNFLLAIKMTFYGKNELTDEVLKLGDTLDVRKDSVDDKLKFAMTTAFVYDLVKKHTERFDEPESDVNEAVFKDFMVKYIRVCIAQASGVDELCPAEDEGDETSQETVACAIYPFYSLFRHGCCPNVFAQHHGLKRVLRAIRTIKKGQECLVSFGPHYIAEDKEERQNRLFTQYRFNCTCRACTDNWPQLEQYPYLPPEEDLLFMFQVKYTNIDLAKRTLPKKINKLKQLEKYEPRADLTFQQKILLYCYDILGNKRLIY